jgi:hypothetical protein
LHPGPVDAGFEPSGAVPLWVGVMPDRDSQWQVLEQELARGPRLSPGADGPSPSAGATDARISAVIRARDSADVEPAMPPSRWAWIVGVTLLLIAGALLVTLLVRQSATKRDLSRFDVTDALPAAAQGAASAGAAPDMACAGLVQPELRQCLQRQCDQAAWRDSAQCTNLRRQGDIQ